MKSSAHQTRRTPLRLGSRSLAFLRAGHTVILLALCDFAARLHAGTTLEPRLYIADFMRSVAVAFVLLWGAGLGLDLWEKQ